LVSMLAERCVWLEHGQVRKEGPAEDVVDAYLNSEDLAVDDPTGTEDF